MKFHNLFALGVSALMLSACQVGQTSNGTSSTSITNASYATSFGRRVNFRQEGDITVYEGTFGIPGDLKPTPNDATLRYYLRQDLRYGVNSKKYQVRASSRPLPLKYDLEENMFLTNEMNSSSILSYLYYDSGSIVYSARTPDNRFGDIFTQNTTFHSNSVGKSLVSYVLGHAICEGYIPGIDATLSDWSLMQDTVYENQLLVDLLNMTAQDRHVVDDSKGLIPTGRWYNIYPLGSFARNELRDTQPNRNRSYHYNGLVTNVLMNYTIYKVGDDYENLLTRVFRHKVGIANNVNFRRTPPENSENGRETTGWYMFDATPEDYMRIAIAMMNDWQQDTCVGQYLKQVSAAAVKKNVGEQSPYLRFRAPRSYGGQFHLNFVGMSNRDILGLEGYGGQTILIDTTNSRIVVINSIHDNYDWDMLAYDVIRRGRLPN